MTTLEWLWIPFWPIVATAGAVFLALFLVWLGVLYVLSRGGLRRHCCERWDPLYGCPETICPGCYLEKEHDDYHCTLGCTCVKAGCRICTR